MLLFFGFLKKHFSLLIFVFFAIALQIQITLFSHASYPGLRLNLADLALPVLGVYIFSMLTRGVSAWPRWERPIGYWCFILLSGVIFLSCINGYFTMGQWSNWALFNKTVGWFVLMGYLGCGAWLAQQTHDKDTFKVFIVAFLGFISLSLIYDVVTYFIYWEMQVPTNFKLGLDVEGFMQNRNAFAFLFLTALFMASESVKHAPILSKSFHRLILFFWGLVPFCILMNGSRALWVCLFIFIFALMTRYKKQAITIIIPALLIGSIFTVIIFQDSAARALRPFQYASMIFEADDHKEEFANARGLPQNYEQDRITTLLQGLQLIREYPVMGAGLGAVIEGQRQERSSPPVVMDNTLFWVLVEMGPLGLFSFLFIYIMMLHSLFKRRNESALIGAAFFMLLSFGVFSLFHEVLYTRFLWFILGMTLIVRLQKPTLEEKTGV